MIGHRIHQARQAAGLSLRALAEKTGITAMAISKYENNQSMPSSGVLLSLATALGVRAEYFFRQNEVALTHVSHRDHQQLPEKEEKKVLADVTEQLERWLALEDVMPAPWSRAFTLPADIPAPIQALDVIEDVALAVRSHWQLGTNALPDLIDTLETKGIKVLITQYDGHKHFNGMSARVNGAPVVVVGKHWSGDRQRFTLAHELGHLVLHDRLADSLDEELACHRFASAFLAPKPAVLQCLGERRSQLELQELYLLKQDWGLSMQAWSYRAHDLGVISKAAFKTLWQTHLRAWKEAEREPGEQYPQENTSLFKQLVYRALAEDRLGESKAAELLGMPVSEFAALRKMEFPHGVVDQ